MAEVTAQGWPAELVSGPDHLHAESSFQTVGRRERPPTSTPTHRHEATVGIFTATVSFEHTLVIIQHKARVTDAALLAGDGDFVARALTVAVWVQAGRRAGWKAVCVVTVRWALQSCGLENSVS